MKKTLKTIFILVTLLLLLISYLINSKYIISNFLDYTNLFITKLFPVTFINFIFSFLLIEYGLLDLLPVKINGLYVFFLSLLSGFPSGAKYTKEIFEKDVIDYDEGNNILLYTHFPNPLFLFGSINYILNDTIICIKLFISILLSNFIIFLFSKKKIGKKNIINNKIYFSNVLNKAIISSIKTIILIYGTSMFFYLIVCIISKYIYFNSYIFIIFNGIFDLTKGVFSTIIIKDTFIKSLFILFFISFGSISIHMQVKSIISNKLSYKYYFIGRVISTILSFIIFFIIKKF